MLFKKNCLRQMSHRVSLSGMGWRLEISEQEYAKSTYTVLITCWLALMQEKSLSLLFCPALETQPALLKQKKEEDEEHKRNEELEQEERCDPPKNYF